MNSVICTKLPLLLSFRDYPFITLYPISIELSLTDRIITMVSYGKLNLGQSFHIDTDGTDPLNIKYIVNTCTGNIFSWSLTEKNQIVKNQISIL